MIEVILDFETANGVVDLAKVGSTAYAKHWATEILCLVANGVLWTPGDRGKARQYLWIAAKDPNVVFIAHNAGFEKDIWRFIMVPQFGFPDIPNERWHDTMAPAALRGLPQGLDKLLLAVGLPGKDLVGSRLTKSLSKINKKTLYFDRRPEILQRVYEYCRKDFSDELAIHQKLGYLPPKEHHVWLLDQEINEFGLRFDLDMARGAMRIYDQVAPQMAKEFKQITGLMPTQVGKFKDWLWLHGLDVAKLDKTTITELLGDDEDTETVSRESLSHIPDLPGNVRRTLFLRGLIGSSSVTKYGRILGAADQETQRIYRLLSYHGAGTGRWAGRLLNPHNMPRGVARDPKGGNPNPGTLAAAIRSGNPQNIEALGLVKDDGSPAHVIEILGSALRNTVVPAPGKIFLVSDWSNIEARLVLAFAGQRDKLDLIAAGKDPYTNMASLIYHREVTKADVEMRQTGKNTVLGCGFQMGWKKFRERYCPKETPKFAFDVIQAYRKDWAPMVPIMWNGTWTREERGESNWERHGLKWAAFNAVSGFKGTSSHGITYQLEGSWLVGHCPDGSCLYYYRPTLAGRYSMFPVLDDDLNPVLNSEGLPIEEKKWVEGWRYQVPIGKSQEQRIAEGHWVWAYGGLLTENYIQHMARQLLCRSLHLCKQAGLQVVLHNQDEIVCEVEPHRKVEELQQIMESRPQWAIDIHLPIATEAWSGDRYRK